MSKKKSKKGAGKKLKPLNPEFIAINSFAGNLSHIASWIADSAETTVKSLGERNLSKKDILLDLGGTLDSIEEAEQQAQQVRCMCAGQLKQTVEDALTLLQCVHSPIGITHFKIYHLSPKKDRELIYKHCMRAYKRAARHTQELEVLSSRLVVKAEEFTFSNAAEPKLRKGITLKKFLLECCGRADIDIEFASFYQKLRRAGKKGDITWPLAAVTWTGKPTTYQHKKNKFKYYRLDDLLRNWLTYEDKVEQLPPLTKTWREIAEKLLT